MLDQLCISGFARIDPATYDLSERWAKFQVTRLQRQQESGATVTVLPKAGSEAENVEKKEGINL